MSEATTDYRQVFELGTARWHWNLRRSDRGYYMDSHVEYAWMGFCMALGIDHESLEPWEISERERVRENLQSRLDAAHALAERVHSGR